MTRITKKMTGNIKNEINDLFHTKSANGDESHAKK